MRGLAQHFLWAAVGKPEPIERGQTADNVGQSEHCSRQASYLRA